MVSSRAAFTSTGFALAYGREDEAAAVDEQFAFGAAHFDAVTGDAGDERGFEGRGPSGGILQKNVDRVGRGTAVRVGVDAAGGDGVGRVVLVHEEMDGVDPAGGKGR